MELIDTHVITTLAQDLQRQAQSLEENINGPRDIERIATACGNIQKLSDRIWIEIWGLPRKCPVE